MIEGGLILTLLSALTLASPGIWQIRNQARRHH
jgi:hypothetical protein